MSHNMMIWANSNKVPGTIIPVVPITVVHMDLQREVAESTFSQRHEDSERAERERDLKGA